ncbi:MAG TPA: hypothetical protein V6C86_24345 [Oculatellaceae cyanobacterium]
MSRDWYQCSQCSERKPKAVFELEASNLLKTWHLLCPTCRRKPIEAPVEITTEGDMVLKKYAPGECEGCREPVSPYERKHLLSNPGYRSITKVQGTDWNWEC